MRSTDFRLYQEHRRTSSLEDIQQTAGCLYANGVSSSLWFYRNYCARQTLKWSAGDMIDGASGIRKIKVPTRAHRKCGRSKYLLLLYGSHADCAADDLTPAESKALKQITESWR